MPTKTEECTSHTKMHFIASYWNVNPPRSNAEHVFDLLSGRNLCSVSKAVWMATFRQGSVDARGLQPLSAPIAENKEASVVGLITAGNCSPSDSAVGPAFMVIF